MGKVVQEGVFDPREYKQNDPNWAKKRKPEYMGPGKILYRREFNEDDRPDRFVRRDYVAEYRASKSKSATPEPREPEPEEEEEEYLEIPIQQEPAPAPMQPPQAAKQQKPDLWPKRVRSDITIMWR